MRDTMSPSDRIEARMPRSTNQMAEGKPHTTGNQDPIPFEYDLPSVLRRGPEHKPVVRTSENKPPAEPIPWKVKPKLLVANNSSHPPASAPAVSESKIPNRARMEQPIKAEAETPQARSKM